MKRPFGKLSVWLSSYSVNNASASPRGHGRSVPTSEISKAARSHRDDDDLDDKDEMGLMKVLPSEKQNHLGKLVKLKRGKNKKNSVKSVVSLISMSSSAALSDITAADSQDFQEKDPLHRSAMSTDDTPFELQLQRRSNDKLNTGTMPKQIKQYAQLPVKPPELSGQRYMEQRLSQISETTSMASPRKTVLKVKAYAWADASRLLTKLKKIRSEYSNMFWETPFADDWFMDVARDLDEIKRLEQDRIKLWLQTHLVRLKLGVELTNPNPETEPCMIVNADVVNGGSAVYSISAGDEVSNFSPDIPKADSLKFAEKWEKPFEGSPQLENVNRDSADVLRMKPISHFQDRFLRIFEGINAIENSKMGTKRKLLLQDVKQFISKVVVGFRSNHVECIFTDDKYFSFCYQSGPSLEDELYFDVLLPKGFEPHKIRIPYRHVLNLYEGTKLVQVNAIRLGVHGLRNQRQTLFLTVGHEAIPFVDVPERSMYVQVWEQTIADISSQIDGIILKAEMYAKAGLTMAKFFQGKLIQEQRAALGSILAGLLSKVSNSDNKLISRRGLETVLLQGKQRLRCITLDDAAWNSGFEKFLRSGLSNGVLSSSRKGKEKCPLDLSSTIYFDEQTQNNYYHIDYFLSHCWADNIDQKLKALHHFSDDFRRRHNRAPTLWIDLFCIDQDAAEVALNVQLLPVFLMFCDKMLVFNSKTYTKRLWCLTEIYTKCVLDSRKPAEIIEFINVEPETETINHSLAITCEKAKCSNDQDTKLLLEKLNSCPGKTERVNEIIKHGLAHASDSLEV